MRDLRRSEAGRWMAAEQGRAGQAEGGLGRPSRGFEARSVRHVHSEEPAGERRAESEAQSPDDVARLGAEHTFRRYEYVQRISTCNVLVRATYSCMGWCAYARGPARGGVGGIVGVGVEVGVRG